MIFGYSPFDSLFVLGATALAAWLLIRRPVRLMAYLPSALCLYFFIPFLTLLTLWQTIPLLLLARIGLRARVFLPRSARPILGALFLIFCLSALYAFSTGTDLERAAIRSLYYLSAFALLLFSYEMSRTAEGYALFVRGFAVLGVVLALYGAYQIVAFYAGLPMRGIVRGTRGADIAFENGLLRINSLANEPKRLGYVMFVSALACFALAAEQTGKPRRRYHVAGAGVLAISITTFAGSYFLAIALFLAACAILYPIRMQAWLVPGAGALLLAFALGYGQPIAETIQHGVERRVAEIEVGLEGQRVYRQELYAQDYFFEHPWQIATGVGIGQYYKVLNREYGPGAGYGDGGSLVPMNSTFFELTFDFGAIGALLFYSGLIGLILQLWRNGQVFLTLALLFLTVQSLTILTQLYVALFVGVSLGQLQNAPRHAPRRAARFSFPNRSFEPVTKRSAARTPSDPPVL
ncbi:MAG: hypothetical protein AAGJ91_07445 [Pseudomonadota bacterium]